MPDSMSEEKATAILLANLKTGRNKPSNLLEIAQACRTVIQSWGMKKTHEFFKVSEYQLRQIDRINDLREDVQKLVEDGRLGIDVAYQLSRLDGMLQSKAATVALDMKEEEWRPFVQLLVNDETMTIEKARRTVDESKKKRLNLLILPLTEDTFTKLRRIAKAEDENVHDLVLQVLEEYIAKKEKG